MRSLAIQTVTGLLALAIVSGTLPAGFDPSRWPGEKPATPEYKTLVRDLADAQKERDIARVRQIVLEIQQNLGAYAGVPQVKPEYGSPIERGLPNLHAATEISWRAFSTLRSASPWNSGVASKTSRQPRLRVTTRMIVSDLRALESGSAHAQDYRTAAIEGMNYLVSQQASTGVFGYPYDPNAKEGISGQVVKIVREGESRGVKMVEGSWLIEDGQDGGLQFDNGESGAALLYGYALTGDERYLKAARRAADWAIGRPIVPNWNYNSYSGYLLSRMYRVTGERKYLDAAIEKFEFGVLPGQMENGRWVDQHNARPQYHALMTRNLIEYVLALEQARDPRAPEARHHTMMALDSLAEEQNRYGASNVEEGLPLEALAMGILAFGQRPEWDGAASIQANYEINYLLPAVIDSSPQQRPPGVLTAYILERMVSEHSVEACEISIVRCMNRRRRPR